PQEEVRVDLGVAVYTDHDVVSRRPDADVHGVRHGPSRVVEKPQARDLLGEPQHDLPRAVAAHAVDDEYLDLVDLLSRLDCRQDGPLYVRGLVAHGQNHGDVPAHGAPSSTRASSGMETLLTTAL